MMTMRVGSGREHKGLFDPCSFAVSLRSQSTSPRLSVATVEIAGMQSHQLLQAYDVEKLYTCLLEHYEQASLELLEH